jgi:hypothetical protein
MKSVQMEFTSVPKNEMMAMNSTTMGAVVFEALSQVILVQEEILLIKIFE